ncbi:hypothetical protein SAMN05192558_102231 [Actinokineospora alba]|uniref:Uncharacterized protein n=1 Tax=Actinokineospora alba TaxID=504798 RepID=A0A1H0HRZ9_9PSEU|nr:hypothetical protein [Actinokineospora alba]TDP64775.1 hypothetical protein C8E96_0247 [Actinokineospora alba]SDH45700.1 hypothetical protein SAMN05421871_10172 [Actinokineospora alba]SDO21840.1 hypothetical protein SAMN05192558_102231 [Actinokineospora alba]
MDPEHRTRGALRAGLLAGVLSGAPSTAWAIVAGQDPLAATRAAGSLILPNETRPGRLLVAAVVVHTGLSLGWATALATTLPRRHTTAAGAVAGLAIAALDLGLIGRRLPRIRALPVLPQVADHVAFGLVAGSVLARTRTRINRRAPGSP